MPVDIQQLPIPDWDLHCPQCRYPLVGLPTHRCPECGLVLEMDQIVGPLVKLREPRFTGSERPLPDFGLVCGRCARALAGATGDACGHCGQLFACVPPEDRDGWVRVGSEWSAPLSVMHLQSILAEEQVPHVPYQLRPEQQSAIPSIVAPRTILVRREFWFEMRWLITRARSEMRDRVRKSGEEWTCPACGESVPYTFDICWQCQTAREA